MIQPLNDNLLVEIEEKTKTDTGIFIASTNHIIEEIGTVKAIGENVKKRKVGDKVMFKSYYLDSIEIKKQVYHFIQEKNLTATIQ